MLLAVAAAVVRAASAVERVWPGFWPRDQAFALRPFQGGALFIAPGPPIPAEAVALSRPIFPDLRGVAFYFPDSLAERVGPMIDLAYDVGGRLVPAVGLWPMKTPDRLFHTVTYLYHESFHAYQRDHFAGRKGRGALDDAFIDPRLVWAPEFRASMAVERRILAAALERDDAKDAASLARAYLAVRNARMDGMPDDVAEGEQRVERKEGSAHRVGYEAALIAVEGTADRLPTLLREQLLDPELEGDVDPGNLYDAQLYRTGAAIGVLLDRFGVDRRRAIEHGASFPELLAAATDFGGTTAADLAAETRGRFGYAQQLARFRAYPAYQDPLAAFERQGAFRVVIIGLRPSRISTLGDVAEPIPHTTVYPAATTLTLTGALASLESRGHPVLSDRRTNPPHYTILLPAPPTLNGAEPADGSSRFPGLVLRADGLVLRIDTAVIANREGDSLVVRIAPRR